MRADRCGRRGRIVIAHAFGQRRDHVIGPEMEEEGHRIARTPRRFPARIDHPVRGRAQPPIGEPVEQLASLRAIPGLIVLRPADANEVAEAWRVIMGLRHEPAVLVLSRQALPTLDRSVYAPASGVARGAYILADAPGGAPEVILLASGSEVALCVQAYEQLASEGIRARVVSVPSWELFEQQEQAYRDQVLPPTVTARISVEQASTFGWARFTGLDGIRVGMRTFGASAPLKELQRKFGFTPDQVVASARELARKG